MSKCALYVTMPPSAVKTIRDLIFYEYAKLIARSAGFAGNYAFIMKKYTELREGRLAWSNLTREHRKEFERGKSCTYCGSPRNIGFDHIIPLSKGGTDTPDNLVACCASCNTSKGDRDLYDWWVNTLHRDEDTLPRIVAGKYLKLIYDIHKEHGTLDSTDLDGDSKLTVLDLGVVLDSQHESTPSAPKNKPATTPRKGDTKTRKRRGAGGIHTRRTHNTANPSGRGLINRIRRKLNI